MSRRFRWAPVAVALLLAACGGSSDDDRSGAGAEADGGATTAPSAAAPSATVTSSSSPGSFGPGPLVPSPGQAWTDLYPGGTPPVFPLPGSSRALGSPQAAATAFARDMLGMDAANVAVDQQDDERAALTLQGSSTSTRLDLRRGELGWEVLLASADGLDLEVTGTTGAGPTGVDRTIDVTGASAAPAGTTVDVVDLADGRLVLRQAVGAAGGGPGSGPMTLTLPDPLPQLAAVIFYVPEGPSPTSETAARRASAASISPVQIRPS